MKIVVKGFAHLACACAVLAQALGQPANNNNVVIFEKPNFAGRSLVLATEGNHPITDWKPGSIRVATGLVATLSQFANAAGGFGIFVDLMEDHADLAPFGLGDNIALVNVFPATRNGLVWARNAIVNGQFVAGHWERPRVGGNPPNPVAV